MSNLLDNFWIAICCLLYHFLINTGSFSPLLKLSNNDPGLPPERPPSRPFSSRSSSPRRSFAPFSCSSRSSLSLIPGQNKCLALKDKNKTTSTNYVDFAYRHAASMNRIGRDACPNTVDEIPSSPALSKSKYCTMQQFKIL